MTMKERQKQTQYTPGPWHVLTEGDSLPIVQDAKGRDVAWVRDGWLLEAPKSLETSAIAANARLIAAAPELLEALVALRIAVKEAHPLDAYTELENEALFLTEAALAKAVQS